MWGHLYRRDSTRPPLTKWSPNKFWKSLHMTITVRESIRSRDKTLGLIWAIACTYISNHLCNRKRPLIWPDWLVACLNTFHDWIMGLFHRHFGMESDPDHWNFYKICQTIIVKVKKVHDLSLSHYWDSGENMDIGSVFFLIPRWSKV